MSRHNTVETSAFKEETIFGTFTRMALKLLILPRTDPKLRNDYESQFTESSRNVEVTLSKLLALVLQKPQFAWQTLVTTYDWLTNYHVTQSKTEAGEHYIIYTQHDHKIPFQPDEDIMYSYMVTQAAYFAEILSKLVTPIEFKKIAEYFFEANRLGTNVYTKFQTVMPRFTKHNRLSMAAVQYLDKPLNCCPSLHITYSLLIDNIASKYVLERGEKNDFEDLRYSTLRMFNSVLYTKQHALSDVAYGMLCAKKAYNKYFAEAFDDLSDQFPKMQQTHKDIDYGEIIRIYKEARLKDSQGMGFTENIQTYLVAGGFPVMRMNDRVNHVYFDTEKKVLIDF